jgi:hypothetical protein
MRDDLEKSGLAEDSSGNAAQVNVMLSTLRGFDGVWLFVFFLVSGLLFTLPEFGQHTTNQSSELLLCES